MPEKSLTNKARKVVANVKEKLGLGTSSKSSNDGSSDTGDEFTYHSHENRDFGPSEHLDKVGLEEPARRPNFTVGTQGSAGSSGSTDSAYGPDDRIVSTRGYEEQVSDSDEEIGFPLHEGPEKEYYCQ